MTFSTDLAFDTYTFYGYENLKYNNDIVQCWTGYSEISTDLKNFFFVS